MDETENTAAGSAPKEQPHAQVPRVAPDSITMAGIESAVKGSGAAVHSETHDLFSPDDIQHILERARVARDHFAQPGQSG